MNRPAAIENSLFGATRIAAAVAIVVWMGLLWLAGEFGSSRLWGLNHLAFVSPGMRWAAIVAAMLAAAAILTVRRPLPISAFRDNILAKWPGLIILMAIMLLDGWLLRARTALLGDGFMRAADALTLPSPMPSEFLPSAAAMALLRLAPPAWGLTGQEVLQIVSVAAGVILAAGLWYFAPRAGLRRPWLFVFFLLTFGSSRLLAGYIESYALPFAFVALWAVTAVGHVRGRLPAWPPIVFCLLAVSSHYAALTIAPATAWALWSSACARRTRPVAFIVYAVSLVGIGGLLAWEIHRQMIAGLGLQAGQFLLPPLAKPPMHYGIFSPAHLLDFLNQWLLLLPGALLAGIMTLLLRRAGARPDDEGATDQSRRRGEQWFWVLAIAAPLGASLVLDPKLGWARDWDLFTIFFTPALVAVAIWVPGLADRSVRQIAGAAGVISCALWMSFAVDTGAERRRFEALLELDVSRAPYGYEILALDARERGQKLGEVGYYQKALALADNNRIRANIANIYYNLGRLEESLQWSLSVVERDSLDLNGAYGAALTLARLDRWEEALPLARLAVKVLPDDAERNFSLGNILYELRRPGEALPHFENAARLNHSDPAYLNMLGGCYLELGRSTEALTAWRQAVRVDPGLVSAYLNAARLDLTLGNFVEARQYLTEYENRVPPGRRHAEARFVADSLARTGY